MNPVMHVRNFSFSSRLAVIVTRLRNKNTARQRHKAHIPYYYYIVYCIITVFRHFQRGACVCVQCECISDSPLMAVVNYAVIAGSWIFSRFREIVPNGSRASVVGLISLLRRALNGRRIFRFIFGGFRSCSSVRFVRLQNGWFVFFFLRGNDFCFL